MTRDEAKRAKHDLEDRVQEAESDYYRAMDNLADCRIDLKDFLRSFGDPDDPDSHGWDEDEKESPQIS